ncbi:hypothetical protein LBMAG42_40660 [Deltaproteobacteria bacterium]|nr:hypothetical protein LBMAG42_40660 [Deltaproteobacteria bacterium]
MSKVTLSPGDVVAKKYEIESLVGTGPMGSSYAARSLGAGKRVCIKLMSGTSVGMATAQPIVTRIQSARSEALVPVLDVGEHAGALFVATEYFEAESLRRLMDSHAGERRSFTLQEACQIVVRVLEAVDAAHQAGLVHRHIKPANVLVHTRAVGPGTGKTVRTIKLNGLGLSELINAGTLAENIADRPDGRYMAPELASPSAGGTVQTDIYSVGVIFYELLTGQTPMGTYLSPTQVRDDLPKHVDDIVDVAIDANAELRYPSARDMINDIQRAFTDDDKPAVATSKRTIGMIVGGCVLALGAVGAFFAFNDPEAQARKEDEAARAKVIKENPIDIAAQKAKVEGHPNMTYIPTGSFISGRMRTEKEGGTANEAHAEETKVEGYYIDLFEFPNEFGGHPVVNATRADAEAACGARGKRLCSSLEWERACKGPEQNIYGYGNAYSPEACGTDPGGDKDKDNRLDRTSGSQEGCKSGWGVFDLSGGAMEWTSTIPRSQPKFGTLKGGKIGDATQGTRCAFSDDRNPDNPNKAIGFRCCMDDNGQLPTDPSAPPPAPPAEPAAPPPAP